MKRFTDTEKYSDPWFRKLPVLYKQFWDYICCRCDNAGVWKPDFELAQFCIGEPLDEEKILEAFKDRIVKLESGNWFIKKFVGFQFGALTPTSRPHQSVLALLKSHGIGYGEGIEGVSIPLKTRTRQDKDNGGCGGAAVPTLEEVITYGKSISVLDETCHRFFDHYQGKNLWFNQFNKLINWKHLLAVWRDNDRAGTKNGPKTLFPKDIKLQIDALQKEIDQHPANTGSVFCSKAPTDLERAGLKQLRAKQADLNKQLANYGTKPN